MAAINNPKPWAQSSASSSAANLKTKAKTTAMLSSTTAASPAGTTSNPYQITLETLAPLERILAGFAHRNKNQHRRARWWASLGILRRNLSRLLVELVAAAGSRAARLASTRDDSPAAVGATSATSAAAAKKTKKKAAPAEDQRLLDEARTRAVWLRDALVPKCWIQFGQLTADPQFAALGVVLLGVLAQVDGACCALVGARPPGGEGSEAVQGAAGSSGMRIGVQAGGDGSAGLAKGIDSKMVLGAGGGRKIARSAAASTFELVGRTITREEAGASLGRGGIISRDDAAASLVSKGKDIAPSLFAAQATAEETTSSSSSSSPLLLSKRDRKLADEQSEAGQEQRSTIQAAQKLLKRKRDTKTTSDSRSSSSASIFGVGKDRRGRCDNSEDSHEDLDKEDPKASKILSQSASITGPPRLEKTAGLASNHDDTTTDKTFKKETTRPATIFGGDEKPPRKKRANKVLEEDEEDIQNKKKKKKKKTGKDEFDNLFNSLF